MPLQPMITGARYMIAAGHYLATEAGHAVRRHAGLVVLEQRVVGVLAEADCGRFLARKRERALEPRRKARVIRSGPRIRPRLRCQCRHACLLNHQRARTAPLEAQEDLEVGQMTEDRCQMTETLRARDAVGKSCRISVLRASSSVLRPLT